MTTVLVFSVLVYLGLMFLLVELNTSDAAGNGITRGVAQLTVIVLWVLLAWLLFLSARAGQMPSGAWAGALLLVPATGAAAFVAIELASGIPGVGRPWPLVVPALAPVAIVGFALWVALPRWRDAVSPTTACAVAGVALSLLAITPWPTVRRDRAARLAHMGHTNDAYGDQQAAEASAAQRVARQRFEQLRQQLASGQGTPDVRLWTVMEFLKADSVTRAEAIGVISTLSTRQADAEEMLERSAWTVIYELPNLSLDPSPALCAGVRGFVREAADKFEPRTEGTVGRTLGYHRVDLYLPALDWLVTRGCDLRAEVAGIEAGLRAFEPSSERDGYLATIAAWGQRAP